MTTKAQLPVQQAFINYILARKLLQADQRVLLAVSGGVDSVVLAHLFGSSPYPFALAHVNFQLRGAASEADAAFVRALAGQLQVPFFETRFETAQLAQAQKKSIQLLARELRYDWLETLRQQEGYDYIATAHHQLDQVETILFNLTKGCGIRGLHGILDKKDYLIRPLLFARKAEILDFASTGRYEFREDASNLETQYDRNRIRLEVIPALKAINPSLESTTTENMERFRQVEILYQQAVAQWQAKLVTKQDQTVRLKLEELQGFAAAETVLYECLQAYGFNNSHCRQILESQARGYSGGHFYSASHEALLDRSELLIRPRPSKPGAAPAFTIHMPASLQAASLNLGDVQLHFKKLKRPPGLIPADTNQALLDFNQLTFPLRLRHWEPGDSFEPLGMPGQHKKLQDFFTDLKLSRFEKDKVWLLDSAGKIAWILGYRIADWAKISAATGPCMHLWLD